MTHRGPFQPLPFCDSVICHPRNTAGNKLVAKGPDFLCGIVPLRRGQGTKLLRRCSHSKCHGAGCAQIRSLQVVGEVD